MREEREGSSKQQNDSIHVDQDTKESQVLGRHRSGKGIERAEGTGPQNSDRVILNIPMVLVTRKRMRVSAPAFLKLQPCDR